MKKIFLVSIGCLVVLFSNISFTAPLPQMKPIAIEGTIKTIAWIPENHVAAKPGFSGSLGKDRIFPAHYVVELIDTLVENSGSSQGLSNQFKSGENISVTVNHNINDGYLKKGMRIKIYDYKVSGDEGGTWYSFSRIDFIK
jgi:hypothetical protein